MNAIDITKLQLDYAVVRMALERLVWAINEDEYVERMLENAKEALRRRLSTVMMRGVKNDVPEKNQKRRCQCR